MMTLPVSLIHWKTNTIRLWCLCGLLLTAIATTAQDTLPLTPGKIATRSAIIPGWGQWINHQPIKTPISIGVVGGAATATAITSSRSRQYRQAAQFRLDNDPATVDAYPSLTTAQLLRQSAQARQANTYSIIGLLFGYGMNMMDAYTFAAIDTSKAHPPGKAAYYSALFPGLGQIYNGKWWKLPLVYGAIGTGVGFIAFNQQLYNDCRIAYITRTDSDPISAFETDFTASFSNDNLLTLQSQFRRNRDLSYIITFGLYLLNVVDALVDGHLYKFSMDDDLSFQPTVRPLFNPSTGWGSDRGVSLLITF